MLSKGVFGIKSKKNVVRKGGNWRFFKKGYKLFNPLLDTHCETFEMSLNLPACVWWNMSHFYAAHIHWIFGLWNPNEPNLEVCGWTQPDSGWIQYFELFVLFNYNLQFAPWLHDHKVLFNLLALVSLIFLHQQSFCPSPCGVTFGGPKASTATPDPSQYM